MNQQNTEKKRTFIINGIECKVEKGDEIVYRPKGELVKSLRLILGCSQERFAEMLGVSIRTVSNWERQKCRPHFRHDEVFREIDLQIWLIRNDYPTKGQSL